MVYEFDNEPTEVPVKNWFRWNEARQAQRLRDSQRTEDQAQYENWLDRTAFFAVCGFIAIILVQVVVGMI